MLPRHCLLELLLGYAPVVVVVESPGIRDNKRNLGYRIQIFFSRFSPMGIWNESKTDFFQVSSFSHFPLLPPVISHVLLPLLLFFPHPIVLLSPGRETEDT